MAAWPDRLREVALAGAGWAEEERVFVRGDEAAGGELEEAGAVHLLFEVEVEDVERLARIAEAGVRPPAVEEPVLTADELVDDERRDEVERGHPLGLCLAEARFEGGGHAGEAELAEGEFGEGHSWRSRRRARFGGRMTMRHGTLAGTVLIALALTTAPAMAGDTRRTAGGVVEESARTGGHAVRDGVLTFGRTVCDFFTGGGRAAKETWNENAARTKENAREGARDVEAEANR